MKISFSTLGCPEWSWSEITSVAKDLGYDGIEVRGVKNELFAPDIREFKNANAKTARQQLGVLGLELVCLTSACFLHKGDEETLEEALQYVDTAQKLGCRYVRLLGDTDPQPGAGVDDGLVRAALQAVAEYGEKKGVTPLIETNGCYAETTRLCKLLDGVKNTGVLWDINHPYRFFGETPEETLRNIGGFVRHVHIKDSVLKSGRIQYTMIGFGDLPVKKCIDLLQDEGYEGFYSLEWVKRWDLSLEEPGIAFAQYAGFMHALKQTNR